MNHLVAVFHDRTRSKPPVPALAAASIVLSLLAILFGLVAVTTSPILVALAAASLVGAALLVRPVWLMWMIFVLGLLVVGVIRIWIEGTYSKMVWGVSLLGFAVLILVLFRAATTKGVTRGTPGFVWAALAFLLYAILNGLAHSDNAYEFLSGFKRYFQVVGLLFAFTWLGLDKHTVAKWRKLFLFVALVQLPWATYELLWLVPIREGTRFLYPGMVPIDVVAGTFGANMTEGGANGEMAAFLIIMLVFLLARLRDHDLSKKRLAWLSPIIIAPLFMGETKAVVVMLPLAFLTLYRRELLARPHVALAGLAVGALLTVAAGQAYLSITKKNLDALVAETLSYNVYERGYGGYKLNRTTVLSFWAGQQGPHDPAGALFGHGLGSAHDMTGGRMAHRYPGYGISLTAASVLLWEQGTFGTGLFLAILALAWREAGRIYRSSPESWISVDADAIQATIPLFVFFLFYRTTLLESLPIEIVFYTLLGYLAWLGRRASCDKA
ncbi:MAG TPA: hypothetical protein PKC23_07145 [Candidatus Desulfobacillus sp.]|nr:hypothetical protein [Candidatus Desulfobacillus sp.]